MIRLFCALLLALFSALPGHAEAKLVLGLPIACTPGKDCFIQQYVDVQPGPGAKDYHCGTATYEEHSGTDFRLLSVKAAAAGIPVVASAAGRIKAVRHGMEDRLTISPEDKAAAKDRECGNGVVIEHEDGWETQNCHMQRGSVTVRAGEMVAAGEPLGLVGFSGSAQFPHVHLAVRRDGKVVDPFLGEAVTGTCQREDAGAPGRLWDPALSGRLAYSDALIIEARFADGPVTPEQAERGEEAQPQPGSPALVFFARLIDMRAGDRISLKVDGPGGFQAMSDGEPLGRAKAQYVGFAGKKRTAERWPAGLYEGAVAVIRDGKVIGEAKSTLQLP
jgi:hypothetical protein